MKGASDQLKDELYATVVRYAQESDISICEAIGVLEILKEQLIHMAENTED